MPPRKLTPTYAFHKQSGRGRATWTDPTGVSRQRLLPGSYESQESLRAFAKLQLELTTAPHAPPPGEPVTVSQLFLAFRDHAEKHYRRADGTPTNEVVEYAAVSKLIRPMYGETAVQDFGPLALKAIRELMIGQGWCRSLINQRIGRLKRVFKWGVGEELVPAAVHVALAAVTGLQRGRSKVRESAPVTPVIDAVMPFLSRHVRGLVEFQRFTGSRLRDPRPVSDSMRTTSLPESNRAIVKLRIEGHELAEIAEQTGRSLRTVERGLQDFRSRVSSN